MAAKKRRLGRGLEALLIEMPAMAETTLHSQEIESAHTLQQSPFVVTDLQHTVHLSENKQPLNRVLLKEAEALKDLLGELETILQAYSL